MAITTVSQHVVSVNAIQGTLIADNAITAVHIATNAVSGTLIADNAVTATHIAQNTITVTQLADDAVEADKIADGVITTNHLNKAMISSQTEVTPVAGDFVLIGDTSDSNNLKKTPISGITALVDLSSKLNLSGGTLTGGVVIGGDSSINRGNQTSGELLIGGTTDGGFVDFDGTSLQLNTQRDPNTGTFINTSKSHGGITISGGDADSNIRFYTSDANNTVATEKMRIHASGCVGIGSTADRSLGSGIGTLVINGSGGGGLWLSDGDQSSTTTKIYSYNNGSVGELLINQGTGVNGGSMLFNINESNKFRINSNGNVGVGGNSTPAQAFEIYRNSSSGSAGGYAGLSLRNDNSSGYMAVQFHEGGTLHGDILFQNGVDDMMFRVGGGGTERMRITSSGTLLISTNAASGLSNSNSNFGHSLAGGQQVNSTNNDLTLILNRSLGSGDMVAIRNNGSTVGSISQNGSNVTYGGTSDYRLKENVTDMTNATTRLKQLKPKRFNYISDTSDTLVDGFLAHEVSSLVPEAVVGNKDAVDSEGDPVWQMMDNSKLVPLLVKTIQELEARIAALES